MQIIGSGIVILSSYHLLLLLSHPDNPFVVCENGTIWDDVDCDINIDIGLATLSKVRKGYHSSDVSVSRQ